MPPNAQLSSIEDFKFFKKSSSINDVIYVGNFSKYVTELGFSSANPGGLLLDFDTKQMKFKKSKSLPLPINKDFKEIIRFDKNYLILENVDRLLKSPASQRGRDFGIMLKALGSLAMEAGKSAAKSGKLFEDITYGKIIGSGRIINKKPKFKCHFGLDREGDFEIVTKNRKIHILHC